MYVYVYIYAYVYVFVAGQMMSRKWIRRPLFLAMDSGSTDRSQREDVQRELGSRRLFGGRSVTKNP